MAIVAEYTIHFDRHSRAVRGFLANGIRNRFSGSMRPIPGSALRVAPE
jgi:hypothetical protein